MGISEFRVALTTDDFNRAVGFFRDGLGLDPGTVWEGDGNGQIFWAGRAALEIFDPQYAAGVDDIEVGKKVSGQIRFAFEVEDLDNTLTRAIAHGGVLVHKPVDSPWGDTVVRIQSPDGMQITLFEKKEE